ncbi:DUF6575 domain-containing protein [Kribbella sp. NPDC002412]
MNTILGDLELDETFVYYDGPRVFSAKTLADHQYIAAWAEARPTEDLWIYTPISAARLRMVKSGAITLREAFTRSEGVVYIATLPHQADSGDRIETWNASELRDEWLPDEDYRLGISTPTVKPALDGDSLRRLAIQESRGRLRVHVRLPDYLRTEAPTKKIGELLIATQSVIENIGLSLLTDNPPQAGRIPVEVATETDTNVVALSAASFVVELAPTVGDDLFGGSAFSRIAEQLLKLLDTGLEREPLFEDLVRLRPRGARSFRNFVRTLASTGGDIAVSSASAVLPYTERQLSADRLGTLNTILNNLIADDQFEIRGRMRLYRADVDAKQFGLRDEETGNTYTGFVTDRASRQFDHAEMNEIYDVVISEFRTLDEATGEHRPRYILDQLSSASSDAVVVTERRLVSLSDQS